MSRRVLLIVLTALSILLVASGCSLLGGSKKLGKVSLALTDAPGDLFSEVHVSIARVDAQRDGKWETLKDFGNEPIGVDLLKLRFDAKMLFDGKNEYLPAGEYSQMRLILNDDEDSSYVVEADTQEKVPLKIPSGGESGLKIDDSSFTVLPETVTALLLDIDAKKFPENRKKDQNRYIMRPTAMRLVSLDEVGGITGVVRDGASPLPEKATISVVKDGEVLLSTESTVESVTTDTGVVAPGTFRLHGIPVGEWTISISADNYMTVPMTVKVTAGPDTDLGPIAMTHVTTD